MKTLLIPVAGMTVLVMLFLLLGGRRDAHAQGPLTCSVPTAGATAGAPGGGTPYAGVTLSPNQLDTARTIVGVAKALGITRRGAVIAIQTAMQESSLDPSKHNGTSLGSFQQQAPGPYNAYVGYDPSHDTAAAAKGFYTVLQRSDPGYDSDPRPNHEIAQLVQRSGAGAQKYAPWQGLAEALVGALFDGSGTPLNCADHSVKGRIAVTIQGNQVTLPPEAGVQGVITAASEQAATAIGAGLSWLGATYAWGGGNANGPTKGVSDNGGEADQHGDLNKVGFDCAGLTLYSWAQAGVMLTRPSDSQLTNAKLVVPYAQAQPGDLLFWGTHHVAMYLGVIGGKHMMLEAPNSGEFVRVSEVRTGGDFRGVAARPGPRGGAQ